MKKRVKLQAAILAVIASSSYADESCLTDVEKKEPLEVFQCVEEKQNRQQKQIGRQQEKIWEQQGKIQTLTQKNKALKTQVEQLQVDHAYFEAKQNRQQKQIGKLAKENQALKMRLSLTDGLVAYYPFNADANDASGYGNHGTVKGATLTADRFGSANSAYQFDGNDDHILVGRSDSLNIDHRLTIAAWIKKEANKAYAGLVGNDNSGYTFLLDPPGNHLRLDLFTHGSQQGSYGRFIEPHPIENNTWYHVVVILNTLNDNTSKVTFYVNGQKRSEESTSYNNLLDMPKVYIGYEGYGYRYFKGTIDEVRIYNRALTDVEIQSLYKQR